MGLYKEYTNKSGISMSHWKISSFNADRALKQFIMHIEPYVSKAVHDAGGAPIDSEKRVIQVVDITYPVPSSAWQDSTHYTDYFSPEALEGKNIYEVMYNYLKAHIPFFKEAVDA